MQVAQTINATRTHVAAARDSGHDIGFVPTMGALHAGHRALIQQARHSCGYVVVSIFVNPSQFGPNEDFDEYPRPIEADLEVCRADDVDLVFQPAASEMYPDTRLTTVRVDRVTDGLCGPARPGHFDGVATVVAKLFNIVQPDRAFFGEKDYQQLAVIRRMVRDLNWPIEVVGCPTVRESDGLAISSRNRYLDAQQRRQAPCLSGALRRAADAVAAGPVAAAVLQAEIERDLRAAGPVEIEYVRIVDPETLEEIESTVQSARICLAVRIGPCRLIDNLAVSRIEDP
ncbi:MAG: pantoate--beta-alanine ligase [bacterium]|nr:pantoate--beta-alanine ligase [bacterium]